MIANLRQTGSNPDTHADAFEAHQLHGRYQWPGDRQQAMTASDAFYFDDNSAIMTVDGGVGDDKFQVGQVFATKRDGGAIESRGPLRTTELSFGAHLSNGITLPAVLYGGIGNDQFIVRMLEARADLRLEGEDGNDEFVIRAFALAGQWPRSSSMAAAATTTSSTSVNAPRRYRRAAPASTRLSCWAASSPTLSSSPRTVSMAPA